MEPPLLCRFTTLSGTGAQTAESLAVVPGGESVFVSGNAWSSDEVKVTTATPGGIVANASFQASRLHSIPHAPGGLRQVELREGRGEGGWTKVVGAAPSSAAQYLVPSSCTPSSHCVVFKPHSLPASPSVPALPRPGCRRCLAP